MCRILTGCVPHLLYAGEGAGGEGVERRFSDVAHALSVAPGALRWLLSRCYNPATHTYRYEGPMNMSWLTASPWPILGMVLLGIALLILAAWRAEWGAMRRAERLLAEGALAEATVLSARDSGWRTMGRPHIAYELEVRRPGLPPYQASTRLMIHRPWSAVPYPPGSIVPVRVDPARPERVAFAESVPVLGGVQASAHAPTTASATVFEAGTAGARGGSLFVIDGTSYTSLEEMPPEARATAAQALGSLRDLAAGDEPPGFAANGPDGAAEPGVRARLRELKALLDEGLISAEEYAAKRAAILEEL